MPLLNLTCISHAEKKKKKGLKRPECNAANVSAQLRGGTLSPFLQYKISFSCSYYCCCCCLCTQKHQGHAHTLGNEGSHYTKAAAALVH